LLKGDLSPLCSLWVLKKDIYVLKKQKNRDKKQQKHKNLSVKCKICNKTVAKSFFLCKNVQL